GREADAAQPVPIAVDLDQTRIVDLLEETVCRQAVGGGVVSLEALHEAALELRRLDAAGPRRRQQECRQNKRRVLTTGEGSEAPGGGRLPSAYLESVGWPDGAPQGWGVAEQGSSLSLHT